MDDGAPTVSPGPLAAEEAAAEEDYPSEGTTPRCPNCGAERSGTYCASCGQKNAPLRQPVHHFLQDAATEYFGLDGRLWRSLGLLLFRPGRLTEEYLGGRRSHYLRPVRIYLTATLLFFFLLSVLDPVGRVERAILGEEGAADSTALVSARLAAVDSALAQAAAEEEAQARLVDALQTRADSFRVVLGDGAAAVGPASVDEMMEDLDEAMEDLDDLRSSSSRQRRLRQLEWQRATLLGWPPDSLIRPADLDDASGLVFNEAGGTEINVGLPVWMPESESVQRLRAARTNEEGAAALGDFFRGAVGHLPTVMFLLLPVFALLLKVIYVRRGWYYSEHLVFALHTHAFAFLVFAAMTALLGFSHGARWAVTASQLLALAIPVYFFVAQKRVYGQGWIKTGFKALILGWVYGWLLLLLGLTLALALAAIWG